VKRTHLDLSNDLLENAKLAQELIRKRVDRGDNKPFRALCHIYYYSAYHRCLHFIPGLVAKIAERAKKKKGAHIITLEEVSAFTLEGARIFACLKMLRTWADYKPQLEPTGGTVGAETIEAQYHEFIDLLNSALLG
jgi:hypothetical protein